MRDSARRAIAVVTMVAMLSLLVSAAAVATPLGPPTVDLQGQGLTIAEGGVGLEGLGNGTRNLSVTIGGPTHKAYLYWAGRQLTNCPQGACFKAPNTQPFRDQELVFEGTPITGSIAGTEDEHRGTIGYLADVTNIVQAKGTGAQTFSIADGNLTNNLDRLNGAGLLVIYTDPSDPTYYRIMIAAGLDFVFADNTQPFPDNSVTSPVTFPYDATTTARSAQLTLFAGDADPRNERVDVSDNPSLFNTLDSSDGPSWDTDTHPITIPAGATGTTVQIFSAPETPQPDSLSWVLAALRVPLAAGLQGCTPGYWKNHHSAWTGTGLSPSQKVNTVFTVPAALASLGNSTLDQALAFGGGSGVTGGAKNLLRAATAAMLNAGHSSVNYPMTTNQVRDAVNAALASNNRDAMLSLASQLDADNNRGCPLN